MRASGARSTLLLKRLAAAVALACGCAGAADAASSLMREPGLTIRTPMRMPGDIGPRFEPRLPNTLRDPALPVINSTGGGSGASAGAEKRIKQIKNDGGKKNTASQNTGGGASRPGFAPPPPGERRFVRNEIILDIDPSVTDAVISEIARVNGLTRLESLTLSLTGRRLIRFRIDANRSLANVMDRLARGDRRVAAAYVNALYALTGDAAADAAPAADRNAALPTPAALPKDEPSAAGGDPAQYTLLKLRLPEAHRVATGEKVVVAVIDSGIDANHPDLAGVVVDAFDAVGGDPEPHPHGTGMAGAIASHGRLMGVAPRVQVLAVRAFGSKGGAQGTTFAILKGLDWAYSRSARIVNMSFAGPADTVLKDTLAAARKKGMVLIAAAGNAGPKSPPLFPAADPSVIAVTATDVDDKVFAHANRGAYIALAAPGVDVLVPAPASSYQLTSGTSVAAAHVSGVAALMLERNASLDPNGVRSVLTQTARSLAKERRTDIGAGLADAYQAILAASPSLSKGVSARP